MSEQSNDMPDRKELRQFGVILGGGLILLFGLFFPWLGDRSISLTHWSWAAGTIFILCGLLAPMILRPLHTVWMKIGHALGWFNTRVILGLVFVFIFLPVGLIMRLRKDPMNRILDKNIKTYRIDSTQPEPDNLERPF